jgi:putative heme transporter
LRCVTDLLVEIPPISAGPLLPIEHGGPVEDVSGPRGVDPRRRLGSVALLGTGIVVLVELRSQILGGIRSLGALDRAAALAVFACLLVVLAARTVVNHVAHPGSTLRQGLVLDQISLAANNGLPGGMLISSAARYRVSRSFDHSPESSALGVIAIGQSFCLGRWLLVLVVILHQALVGSVGTADLMVLLSAVLSVTVGLLLWVAVVSESAMATVSTRVSQRVIDRLGLRVACLRNRDVAAFLGSIRRSASTMTVRRTSVLLLAGTLSTLAGATIIISVVNGLGHRTMGPDVWELLRVYLLARVATSFIPTPGALAALDAALVGGLMAAGVDAPSAVAAVLVYRAVTFVLPILTGGLTYLGWRRWEAGTRTQTVSAPD